MKVSPTPARGEAQGIATGNMSRRPEDHGIQVLVFDEYNAVVIVEARGSRWLIKEEVSDYGPMCQREAESLIPGCTKPGYRGDFPFYTDGTRWTIDLNTSSGHVAPFDAVEGEVQGVVYALEALMHGGEAEPDFYADYIHRLVEELNADDLYANLEFDTIRSAMGY